MERVPGRAEHRQTNAPRRVRGPLDRSLEAEAGRGHGQRARVLREGVPGPGRNRACRCGTDLTAPGPVGAAARERAWPVDGGTRGAGQCGRSPRRLRSAAAALAERARGFAGRTAADSSPAPVERVERSLTPTFPQGFARVPAGAGAHPVAAQARREPKEQPDVYHQIKAGPGRGRVTRQVFTG